MNHLRDLQFSVLYRHVYDLMLITITGAGYFNLVVHGDVIVCNDRT